MKSYSFMGSSSNCSKEEAIELIRTTDKGFLYTYGLGYRNPTTHRVPITREKAIEYAQFSLVDIKEEENFIHINRFSGNDLW